MAERGRGAMIGDMPDDRNTTEADHAVDPAPHIVTDDELALLLRQDHKERVADRDNVKRVLTGAALGGAGLAAIALIVAVFALASGGGERIITVRSEAPAGAAAPAAAAAADQPAPTLAQAGGVKFEKYQPVDATLPAVPAGAVKRFDVDVMEHVTQVSPLLAPTKAWTYVVNGKQYRGTAASAPMVVNQGDRVSVTFTNGGSKAMNVSMAHSIDFHSAEVAPSKYYVDIAPGKSETIDFVAKHPGVFMYHCATQPILMHTGAGMVGMMVVKPRGLAPVDRELWMTQGEYYLGKPGGTAEHGQDDGREARRDRVQRLRQPVQGPPDQRGPWREDPPVRAQRRTEQVERLPRHRHRLRHGRSSRTPSSTTARP